MFANVPASIWSDFTMACAIACSCEGLVIIPRATALLLPVASLTTSSLASSVFPESLQRRAAHGNSPCEPKDSLVPDHHLPEGPVDINSDYASHPRLLLSHEDRSGGAIRPLRIRARSAAGESQGRPAKKREIEAHPIHQPARTFVLPESLSRTLAASATSAKLTTRNSDPGHLIPITHPIERPQKEVKRHADVVGIFPNDPSIIRLIGAVLFEANDEWKTSNRYMMVEAFAQLGKEDITLLAA